MRPSIIRAGDTYTWQETWSDYAGWTLKWRLIPVSGTAKEVTAAASGTTFTFTLATGDTNVSAGAYTQLIVATKVATSEQKTLAVETIQVLPNPTSATMPKGYWRTTYETLQATYQRLAAQDTNAMSAHQRTVQMKQLDEIRNALAHAKAMMEQEEAETSGAGSPAVAYGRFVNA